jgi:flagellar biosynthesis GTPase FlhF
MSILEHQRTREDRQRTPEDRAPATWLPDRRDAEIRTYRGKSLEALLPKIRRDLGDDAIVLREREGLMGGVGGFFATRFVEVQARAGGPGIDVYDEDAEAEADAELGELLAAPELPELPAATEEPRALSFAAEFSAQLEQAVEAWSDDTGAALEVASEPVSLPEPEPAVAPEPEPVAERLREFEGPQRLPRWPATPLALDERAAGQLVDELVSQGVSVDFARELVGAAGAHGAAVAGGLREALVKQLTRRLAHAPVLPYTGAAVAFVGTGGSGKSLASAALARSYRDGSTLAVSVASLCDGTGQRTLAHRLADDEVPVGHIPADDPAAAAETAAQVGRERRSGMVILDTPAVSPADGAAVAQLAQRLEALAPDAVYLVLSATLGAGAARRALRGLSALAPTAVVISHADETDELGTLVELVATAQLPVAYLIAGADHRRALVGSDPAALARVLLP